MRSETDQRQLPYLHNYISLAINKIVDQYVFIIIENHNPNPMRKNLLQFSPGFAILCLSMSVLAQPPEDVSVQENPWTQKADMPTARGKLGERLKLPVLW